jgi:cytochrome c oxidase subunit 1
MHFLGLAGMPRHILDYQGAYAGFNLISPYGSFISAFSSLLFLYIIYNTFVTPNSFTTIFNSFG